MNFLKVGLQRPVFETPDGDTGVGSGEHPTAPWGGAEGQMWNIGEGDAAQPWHSFIGDEAARGTVEAKAYSDPGQMATAYHNLLKLQNGDPTVIGVPGEGATPEQMNEFYGKLGRPETGEAYDFKFDESVQVDDGLMGFARGAFHKAGLNNAQAQELADDWNAFQADQYKAFTDQNAKEVTDLETRWGADLEKNKAAGQRVLQALGLGEDVMARFENSVGDAAVIETLAMIGRKADEGGLMVPNSGDNPDDVTQMTKEAAQSEITKLSADDDFQKAYTDMKHPGHAEAVKRMEALFAKAG